MSKAPKSRFARVIQAAALLVVFGVLLAATRLVPEARSVVGTVAALGFLLLAGTLTSELCETVGLPHLSGYILAGLASGPFVLRLIDMETVERLSPVNTLALALIALAGGSELHMSTLKSRMRSIVWAMLFQTVMTFGATSLAFIVLSHFLHLSTAMGLGATIAMGFLWGALSLPRSPSAMLGILAQTRARGPLATFSLAFVMLMDAVVILLVAIVVVLVRPLLDPLTGLSFSDLRVLGYEIVGSIALGVTLGLVLAAYLKVVGKQLLVVLLAVGVGLSELLRYIEFDSLLSFLVAGFVVANFSDQGPKLLAAVQQTATVVFVIFFGLAGAHLDVPILLKLWPVAVSLCVVRGLATVLASKLSTRIADEVPMVRKWGWSGLISQAGLTLGLSLVVIRAFPMLGETFRSLIIAGIGINELVGPIIFKIGLDRAGETRREVEEPAADIAKAAD